MIKLTFQRNPVEEADDFLTPSPAVVHLLPRDVYPPPPLLSVLSELSVPPKHGSNRFASVFLDIKGVGKDQIRGGA